MAARFSTGLRNRILGIDVNLTTIGDFAANITGWTNTVGAAWASTTPSPPTGYTGYLELTPNNGVAAGEARHTAAITVGSGQMLKVSVK
jgi:hypothetical protein